MSVDPAGSPEPKANRSVVTVTEMMRGDPSPPARYFSRVVRAARPAFEVFHVDKTNHIARGVLLSKDGNGNTARLTYDLCSGLITMSVDLGPITVDLPPQVACLLRMQSTARMARFDPDPEHGKLTLRAASVCTRPEPPSFVMSQILKDTQRVLLDDRLLFVLGQNRVGPSNMRGGRENHAQTSKAREEVRRNAI